MPSNFDTYREWENLGSRTTVHIVQIDRGDGSAAYRLTLTDKFYLDKGVDGTKYHDTYPAPVHCIISDLETTESMDQTAIADIVLANGNGKFDNLRSEANIIGHRFTVLRGDRTWSLMEDEYPYKFVEIFRGQIESISVGETVVIGCAPVKYKLDNVVGSREAPIHRGPARNVPALLVDSAADKYRFSTSRTEGGGSDGSAHIDFYVRDNGVELLKGGAYDYTFVEESGYFYSQIALTGGSPDKLTGDLDMDQRQGNTFDSPLLKNSQRLIAEHLIGDYPTYDERELLDYSFNSFSFEDDDDRLYTSKNGKIHQYDLSTPGDIDTQSYVAQNNHADLSLYGDIGIQFRDSGGTLILGRSTHIRQFSVTTDWDITAVTVVATLTASTLIGGSVTGFWVPPSDDALYLLRSDGIVYRLDKDANDVSTAADPVVALRLPSLRPTYNTYKFIEVSPDGKKAFFLHPDEEIVLQYDLVDPYKIESAIRTDKSFVPSDPNVANGRDILAFGFTEAGVFHAFSGLDEYIDSYESITDFDLPRNLITTNISSDQLYYPAGVFYNEETQFGKVLADLLSSIVATFMIDRLGTLRAVRLDDPEDTLPDWVAVHDLFLGDFVGEGSSHITHQSTLSAKSKITVRFDKNYTTQSEAELAGAVTDDNKAYYAAPYEITETTNSLTDYVDPEDLVLDTFLGNNITNAEAVRDYAAGLWDQDRETYDLKLNLRCTSLLSDLTIGSIIQLNGNVRNPNFSDGDRVLVTGRRVNWSKNNQLLTVFR